MKSLLIAAAFTAITITTPALAADVGVSVNVGQPDFYGRLDIGGYPQPRVIYAQPRVIERVEVEREPVYLRVPPGHRKNWARHCREYNACNERVYFVRDSWYNREYVLRYKEQHHGNDHHDERKNNDRRSHGNGHQGNNHDRGHNN